MAQLGLSDPLIVQYLHWMRDVFTGSFGHSFFRSESVADMILRRGPLTAQIALLSVVLSCHIIECRRVPAGSSGAASSAYT